MERIFKTPTTVAPLPFAVPSKQAPLITAQFPKKYLHLAPIIGGFANIGLGDGGISAPTVVNYGGSLVNDSHLLGLSGLLSSTAKF